MAFQTPISIAEAIDEISKNQYLLPAIQREFIWEHGKIEWLFDSIMRDYPISSFLFWEVESSTAQGYKFYKFISEYRERYKTHNEEVSTNGLLPFKAILDGQQRLTALYIGLKGSYAYKEYRRKWENTEWSIPTKQLYLNISEELTDEEDGRVYEFKFLNNSDTNSDDIYTTSRNSRTVSWFKVGKILNFSNDEEFDEFVDELEKGFPKKTVRKLRASILKEKPINFFLEKGQDIHKALNIFIRVNSGGEPLSFSDLIMSIAVANWEKKDARKEIHQLVDNIRDKGFNISKDLILKTYLYLYSRDIKFKVNNFSKENAKSFEIEWDSIRNCMLSTFDLVKTFGFEDLTLTSKNSILPIIYYLYHRKIYDQFSIKKEYEIERLEIKRWLHISLLKQVFGGASDVTLSRIRSAFTNDIMQEKISSKISNFPVENIFSQISKDISVGDDFIDDLLSVQYEKPQSFSILSMLYPHLDYKNNNFHKDHIYPKEQYEYMDQLVKGKYSWQDYNSIINLQMLDANENMSKNKMPLEKWINSTVENTNIDKRVFLNAHLFPSEMDDFSMGNFGEFYELRKVILTEKLKDLLK